MAPPSWCGTAPRRSVRATRWSIAGGFAHGDYLRPGAIARFSPVMEAVSKAAAEGMPVVGMCNGFQVLTEAGLLPGALQKNAGLSFLCKDVTLRVETTRASLTNGVAGRYRAAEFRSITSKATTPSSPRRCARSSTTTRSSCATSTTRMVRSTHRRRVQHRGQRRRPDAPPRARQRRAAGFRGRPGVVARVPERGARQPVAPRLRLLA